MIYMQLDENIVGSSSIAGGSEREFLLRRWSSVGVGTKSSSGLTFQSSRRPGSLIKALAAPFCSSLVLLQEDSSAVRPRLSNETLELQDILFST